MSKNKHNQNGQSAGGSENIYRPDGHRTNKILVEKVIIPELPEYDKIHIEMKGDRILVQTFPNPTQVGAIYAPDNREVAIDRGRVCKLGPDVKDLKVGDIIYKIAGLGQSLVGADKKIYTFHQENSAIAVDTFPHELTPELKLEKEIIT